MADEQHKRGGEDLEAGNTKRSKVGDYDAEVVEGDPVAADDSLTAGADKGSFEDVKISIRVLVEDRQVGGIIGRGGSVISKLRTDTGCKVEIDSSVPEARDRVMTVTGPVPKLPVVLSMIADRLGEPKISYVAGGEKGDNESTITLLVENAVAGGIIGKGGHKVTATRRATGATIKISSKPLEGSTEKSVEIRGESKRVAHCLEMIIYQILEEPDKAVRKPYVPRAHFEDEYAYPGRYGPPPPYYGPPRRMGGPPPMYGGPPPPYGPPAGPAYGPPPGPYPPYAPYPAPPRAPRPLDGGPQTTMTIGVSDKLVGGVIGRGGHKITEIRQRSGAAIKVASPEPNSAERKITVTGSQQACEAAIQMIQARIAEQQAEAMGMMGAPMMAGQPLLAVPQPLL